MGARENKIRKQYKPSSIVLPVFLMLDLNIFSLRFQELIFSIEQLSQNTFRTVMADIIVTAQPQPQPNSTSTRLGVDKVISWTTTHPTPHIHLIKL